MAWVDKELQEKVQTAEEIYRNAEKRIREKLETRRQEEKQGETPDDLEISLDTDSTTDSDSTSEPAPRLWRKCQIRQQFLWNWAWKASFKTESQLWQGMELAQGLELVF
jgi:hypothetical protein